MRMTWLTLSFMVLAAQAAVGQPEDSPKPGNINTARPSFSSAATTLDTGLWQWEGGYQFTSNDDELDTDAHTLPLLFLRLGITDDLELNLSWAGYNNIDSNAGDDDGVSDLSIGFAYQLTDDGEPFEMALFGSLSLPIGGDDFTSDDVDPGIGLAWSYSPVVGPGLFGTVVFNSVSEDDERASTLGAAIGASFAISERLGSYIEYFGQHSDSDDSSHSLGTGLTYLLRNNLQLDINGGVGLNHAADDYFVGAGVGWRY